MTIRPSFPRRPLPPIAAAIAAAILTMLGATAATAETSAVYTVPIAVERRSPSTVRCHWERDSFAVAYDILVKAPDALDWTLDTTGGADLQERLFTIPAEGLDVRVAKVGRLPDGLPVAGDGYMRLTRLDHAVPPSLGRVLLVVDAATAERCSAALTTWTDDCRREGWMVERHVVTPSTAPANAPAVRAAIADRWRDSVNGRLTSVFLVGAVPVPYSGGFSLRGGVPNVDAHPEHGGAWTCDGYYADMVRSGTLDAATDWTDTDVDIVDPAVAVREQNRNVPGDGKFDQSVFPSDIELAVGRLDLGNLPSLGTRPDDRQTEWAMIDRYFAKNHAYRSGISRPPYRALVDDVFGPFARVVADTIRLVEAFGAIGWRAGTALVGVENTVDGDWWPELGRERPILDTFDALFAYGAGPGGYDHCDFVIGMKELTTARLQAVFTMMFGSYFADTDSEDNVLRGVLAVDGRTLTAAWAGRPHWFLHTMAAGATVGEATRLSTNNSFTYRGAILASTASDATDAYTFGTRSIHQQLHGDPTLRMPTPITDAVAVTETSSTELRLTWLGSTEAVYYLVETADALEAPFRRLDSVAHSPTGTQQVTVAATTAGRYLRLRPVSYGSGPATSYVNVGYGAIVDRMVTSVNADDDQRQHDHHGTGIDDVRVYDILGRYQGGRDVLRGSSGPWIVVRGQRPASLVLIP